MVLRFSPVFSLQTVTAWEGHPVAMVSSVCGCCCWCCCCMLLVLPLLQALTRTASGVLSSCTCMELGLIIAALADLHWRPSEAWMAVSAAGQQCFGWSTPHQHGRCEQLLECIELPCAARSLRVGMHSS